MYAKYSALVDEAEERATMLRVLIDHTHISSLKNSKGNLSLKAIKDRLIATADMAENATLSKYLNNDKAQKARRKEAPELLDNIEKHYKSRLTEEPLPEELEDLQTTVRYLDLLDEEKALKSQIKEAHAALDLLAYEAYPQLGLEEIKALVVDDLDYLYSRRDGLCLAETHWTHPTAG